jgi:hypothetical protein
MPNKLNEISEELQQNTLSIEEIEKHELSKEDLYEVKIGSVIMAPFSRDFLKNYAEEKNLSEYNVLIKTMESILWVPILQHPSFFSGETAPTDNKRQSFYLLVNGRKIGPYRIEDIDFKVSNNEVLFTDLVSIDAGDSWKKLYEIEGFDLRRHTEGELPSAPTGEVQEDPRPKKGDGSDPLGELAKIGHRGSLDKQKMYAKEDVPEEKGLGRSLFNIATFVGIIFISIYVFDRIDPFGPEDKAKKTKVKTSVQKKKEPVKRPKAISKPKEEPSPAAVRRLEEKKARRKKAISKRKTSKPKKSRVVEEDPYPDEDDPLDEVDDTYYDDDEPKPKKKPKKKRRAKAKKPTDDDYYDEDLAEEEDPY